MDLLKYGNLVHGSPEWLRSIEKRRVDRWSKWNED